MNLDVNIKIVIRYSRKVNDFFTQERNLDFLGTIRGFSS